VKLTEKESAKVAAIAVKTAGDEAASAETADVISAAFVDPTDKKKVRAARKELARLDAGLAKIQAIVDKPKPATAALP
jgi:hypothetical protein